jgi:hypothetical protein
MSCAPFHPIIIFCDANRVTDAVQSIFQLGSSTPALLARLSTLAGECGVQCDDTIALWKLGLIFISFYYMTVFMHQISPQIYFQISHDTYCDS